MKSQLVLAGFIVAGALVASDASAQDRPAVFLHGLGAEASDWGPAAERLRGSLAIDPRLPGLEWNQAYETQAQRLHSGLLSLPSPTVVVGHSNGGVVAREWSRLRPLDGIVTIGTPHRGAPLIGNLRHWVGYHQITPSFLNRILGAFSALNNFTWVYWMVQHMMGWISDFSLESVWWFTSGTTLALNAPVTLQMVPDSPYLNSLNSGSNLSREGSAVRGRVGIVSVAKNFFYAGPARAVFPEAADEIAWVLYSFAYTLEYWGGYILAFADPADLAAVEQGLALLGVAHHLFGIDPLYCRLISTKDASACIPNDGLLPVTSQEYPGAPNLIIGTSNDGPAHIQEKDQSDDALYHALVWYLGVPSRGAAAPPPPESPTPPPQPDSDPEDDEGGTIQSTGADVMIPGQEIGPGEVVHSENGRYHLSYQGDGNLVLYDEDWQPMWSTGTAGTSAGVTAMQADGNLVVYDATVRPVWSSGTPHYPGAFLVVQNDGNLVVYASDLQPVWSTGTVR